MPWVDVFAVFVVCHVTGDYLLQTEWQATHKRGGLGTDAVARRALASHVTMYTLAFLPALIWLGDELGAAVIGVAALIALPHLVQDDGRAIGAYARAVKHIEPASHRVVMAAVDQSFHIVTLFLVALAVGA